MSNRPDLSPSPEHLAKARSLLQEMHAHEGLAPVDLDQFWHDQELAAQDPFSPTLPQCALGTITSEECVFDELGVPEDYWRYQHDDPWRLALNKAYNDRAEKLVGRRLLSETPADPTRVYPATKVLYDIFEAKNEWQGWSWWLHQSANTEDELQALLDRVEQRLQNLRPFVLPANWDAEKVRLTALGITPPLYRWQRGPCTFACSIFGPENTLMLCLDNPTLAGRFRDTILKAMLSLGRLLDQEAGFNPPDSPVRPAPHGFGFADDNCCLFNPEMYDFFAYPILQTMFATYSPNPTDWRYQHSDSAMAHLLPILGRLNLTGTNFGPTVTVTDIRRHLPRAAIDGQLAPFTLSNNEHERIILEFLRDFEQARPARGLRFTAAGSLNNGSRLTSFRLILSALQRFGRF